MAVETGAAEDELPAVGPLLDELWVEGETGGAEDELPAVDRPESVRCADWPFPFSKVIDAITTPITVATAPIAAQASAVKPRYFGWGLLVGWPRP